MNSLYLLVCPGLLLAIVFSHPVRAQHDASAESTDFAQHSIFLELLGNAFLYSFNYDYRWTEHASVRVGFSRIQIPLDTESGPATVLPIMINYLTGTGKSHLELGIGFDLGLKRDGFSDFNGSSVGIFPTATLGYRYQPREGGFHSRVGFTPILTSSFIPFGGMGFGISF